MHISPVSPSTGSQADSVQQVGISACNATCLPCKAQLVGFVGPNKDGSQALTAAPRSWQQDSSTVTFICDAPRASLSQSLTSDRPLDWGNTTQMVMRTTVRGYAMGIDGWFEVLSVTVLLLLLLLLLLHALLALGHTLWVWCYSEDTSEAWDTITELVSLALTSTVPHG
ncbi:hypothetical protein EDB80DRAFT_681118 [Ilyonectria destructans]|nr:hypothetical protein EDB80DRAFT_681118 [Ilyonectria destructans]